MPFAQHLYYFNSDKKKASYYSFQMLHTNIKEKFFKETNEHIAVWEGEKLTKDGALAVSGIKQSIGCEFESSV
jgi:Xaa-Pro aminopeptidase